MFENLLPQKTDLVPIDEQSLFKECDFKDEFDFLPFEKKLRVVNDLVRQTILSSTRPDPQTHLDTGIGNCHTASLLAIDYLRHLGVGKNYRYVMARIKPFEPDDVLTKHSLVLLDDDGVTYQFDATPFVGYKYGQVAPIEQERFYKEYIIINEEEKIVLNKIFELLLADEKGLINISNIDYYNSIILESFEHIVLNGYTYSCLKALSKHQRNEADKKKLLDIALKINNYHRLADDFEKKMDYRKYLLFKQIREWEDELNILIKEDYDYKRQLELVQSIVQEKIFYNESFEKKINIDNREIHLSHMTPRFFYETGLGVHINVNDGIGLYHLNMNSYDTGIRVDKFLDLKAESISLGNGGMNAPDSSLVYLSGYPEHQIMTKYMYPNKVLCKRPNT